MKLDIEAELEVVALVERYRAVENHFHADRELLCHARTNYPLALQTLLAIRTLCESEGGELAGKVLGVINQGEK